MNQSTCNKLFFYVSFQVIPKWVPAAGRETDYISNVYHVCNKCGGDSTYVIIDLGMQIPPYG
jgi:hypothetical protein